MFDWSLAAEVPAGQRLMIAGGLNAANVAAAIARAQPWGVDAVSGIEREPGRKDPIKMREFIAAARAAGAELDGPEPDDDGSRVRLAGRVVSEAGRGRARGAGAQLAGGAEAAGPGGAAGVAPAAGIIGVGMGDPGPTGRFGDFGGRYLPESLVPACQELEAAFRAAWSDGASGPATTPCCGTTPAGPRRSPSAAGSPRSSASGCCSSGRT